MKTPFAYYGGKYYFSQWIIDEAFSRYSFNGYCEVFGGSGAMLLAKRPSRVEIFNDINGNIINFYRVIRDVKKCKEFLRFVNLTPYSRDMYYESRDIARNNKGAEELTDVERAGHFYISMKLSFGGVGRSFRPQCTSDLAVNISNKCTDRLTHSFKNIMPIHRRLQNVVIENRDAIEFIKQFSGNCVLTYCDPPYIMDTRYNGKMYAFEYSNKQHEELVQTLLSCKGHRVLSGYEHPIYQPLLDAGWTLLKKEIPVRFVSDNPTRIECLYCSPTENKGVSFNF